MSITDIGQLADASRGVNAIRRLSDSIQSFRREWKEADTRVLKWIDLGPETGGFEKLARDERAPLVKELDSYYLVLQTALPFLSETLQRDLLKLTRLFERRDDPRAYWPDRADSLIHQIELLLGATITKVAQSKEPEHHVSGSDQAYGAAAAFINYLRTLAWHARQLTDPSRIEPSADDPQQWKNLAAVFGTAFVAWFDLTHLLTPAVRAEARRVYPPGAPSIKLGKLKAMPSLIESVSDELGYFFRNVLYRDQRHPLDLDIKRVTDEAKERATARQVAQGNPAIPLGWREDYEELMKRETRAAVRDRRGIKSPHDGWMLFATEWEDQDPKRVRMNLELLRCGQIDFDDLSTQLDREARAVLALPKGVGADGIVAQTLARLEDATGEMAQLRVAYGRGVERMEEMIASGKAGRPDRPRQEIVLWEGAEYSERNIRLARTRSAYLEAHGDGIAALDALRAAGFPISRSTLYNHLHAIDKECPGWRRFRPTVQRVWNSGRQPYDKNTQENTGTIGVFQSSK